MAFVLVLIWVLILDLCIHGCVNGFRVDHFWPDFRITHSGFVNSFWISLDFHFHFRFMNSGLCE